jgi:hypothetical protein
MRMSQEPPSPSSVPLQTAAYLAQSTEPEQSAASEPTPAGRAGMMSLRTANGIIGMFVIGALIPVAFALMANVEKERERRKCGLDWLLWAAGSNETFESQLNASLEESRIEFERQRDAALKPFEFQEFDFSTGFGPAPVLPNGDGFRTGHHR